MTNSCKIRGNSCSSTQWLRQLAAIRRIHRTDVKLWTMYGVSYKEERNSLQGKHMLMGLRIKKERKKNPHTAKDSRGIGGGVGVSTILQVLFWGLNNVNSMKLLLLSHNIN